MSRTKNTATTTEPKAKRTPAEILANGQRLNAFREAKLNADAVLKSAVDKANYEKADAKKAYDRIITEMDGIIADARKKHEAELTLAKARRDGTHPFSHSDPVDAPDAPPVASEALQGPSGEGEGV